MLQCASNSRISSFDITRTKVWSIGLLNMTDITPEERHKIIQSITHTKLELLKLTKNPTNYKVDDYTPEDIADINAKMSDDQMLRKLWDSEQSTRQQLIYNSTTH